MTRRQLEERVAALAAEHEGTALVEAVQQLAAELEADERALLGEILLEQVRAQGAQTYDELTQRMRAARWRVLLPPPRERKN